MTVAVITAVIAHPFLPLCLFGTARQIFSSLF